MKPIPDALRAYFPAAVDDARPWWQVRGVNPGSVKWARNDGPVTYSDLRPEERGKIDRADPLPPPPILVGQVWAIPTSVSGSFFVSSLAAIELYANGRRGLHWAGFAPSHPLLDTYTHGFLLSCPFSCAPWSGPEVP